ncbi:hypothetical protein [Nitrobacter sp. JJSN]|uniref:hypothetical protein n=1 Tax=Nitrobacter sp. JJSN TaxID=3453033 RepID=UPI003F7647A0
MISDAKMRAHLLSALHGLRDSNTGWVPTSDMNFGGLEPVTPGRIRTVCEQLAEVGLIVFKPLPGGPDGGLVGMSKITGHGSDVVDGLTIARIALDFPQKVQPEPASSAAAVASPAGASLPMQRADASGISSGAQSQAAPESNIQSEVLILRPTLWGMSIDLKEAYRRVHRKWVQRNA